jgi:hypothetical protein
VRRRRSVEKSTEGDPAPRGGEEALVGGTANLVPVVELDRVDTLDTLVYLVGDLVQRDYTVLVRRDNGSPRDDMLDRHESGGSFDERPFA